MVQLKGTVVQDVLPGTPAHASHQIQKGDRILEVDGVEATEESIASMLTGNWLCVALTLSVQLVVFEPARDRSGRAYDSRVLLSF